MVVLATGVVVVVSTKGVVSTDALLSGLIPSPEHSTFLGKSQYPLSSLVGLKCRPAGQGIRIERVFVHA